jgi:hypothetical protein
MSSTAAHRCLAVAFSYVQEASFLGLDERPLHGLDERPIHGAYIDHRGLIRSKKQKDYRPLTFHLRHDYATAAHPLPLPTTAGRFVPFKIRGSELKWRPASATPLIFALPPVTACHTPDIGVEASDWWVTPSRLYSIVPTISPPY